MTLFEAFHRKKPSISHLQPFGRKCFIHIPKERHLPRSKLMPQAEKGIFVGYTDTSSIYKVHIPTRSHTFIVSTLDVKFKDASAMAEVTMAEVTSVEATSAEVIMSDVTMLDVNSNNGLTSAISISFARPITCSMVDSQQQLIQPQQPLQQVSQPQRQSQTTAVVIPPSLPNAQRNQYIYLDDDHDEQVMISLDKYTHINTEQEPKSYN